MHKGRIRDDGSSSGQRHLSHAKGHSAPFLAGEPPIRMRALGPLSIAVKAISGQASKGLDKNEKRPILNTPHLKICNRGTLF
jgi:hypothetical protein